MVTHMVRRHFKYMNGRICGLKKVCFVADTGDVTSFFVIVRVLNHITDIFF